MSLGPLGSRHHTHDETGVTGRPHLPVDASRVMMDGYVVSTVRVYVPTADCLRRAVPNL